MQRFLPQDNGLSITWIETSITYDEFLSVGILFMQTGAAIINCLGETRRLPPVIDAGGNRMGIDRPCPYDRLAAGKGDIILNLTYFFAPELIKEIDIPERGILSRTLYDDNDVKVVLFGFSAGHELSAHTAPMPAALYFLLGEAELTLGSDSRAVRQGAFAHMPPYLNHAIVAKTPLVMLLIMMKGLKRENDQVTD